MYKNKEIFKIYITFMVIIIMSPCFVMRGAEERITIRHIQEISDQLGEIPTESYPIKTQKKSHVYGKIHIVNIGNSVPDSIMVSAQAAADLWEYKLRNTVPIYIGLCYENLNNEGVAYYCDAVYKYGPTCIPYALYSQQRGYSPGEESPDGILTLNNNIKWNTIQNNEFDINRVCAFTAVSRGIALILGFGTTVVEENGIIKFQTFLKNTKFNDMVFSSSGEWLKDIKDNNTLSDYAQPSSDTKIYALKHDDNHILYSPSKFDDKKSLVYLNNKKSLMHYSFGKGDRFLNIDDVVVELLNSVGWKATKSGGLSIKNSRGLDNNGIGSIYEKFSMRIYNPEKKTISDPIWRMYLPLKSGDRVLYQESQTSMFYVDLISDIESYAKTSEGEIQAEIFYECNMDGERVAVDPYIVTLQLKPIISKVENISFIKNGDNLSFSADLYQSGANTLIMSVSMEDYPYNESFTYTGNVNHVKYDRFYSDQICYVDFTAINKYGKATKSLTYDPENPNQDKFVKRFESYVITTVNVYDISGNFIGSFTYTPGFESNLGEGTYIVNYLSFASM